MIAMIVVTIAAPYAGPALLGLEAGKLAAVLFAAAIITGAGLLISALTPAPEIASNLDNRGNSKHLGFGEYYPKSEMQS